MILLTIIKIKMKADQQLNLREHYAELRRKKPFNKSMRVIWKSKSKLVA